MPVASPESGLSHNASAVDIRTPSQIHLPGKAGDRPELPSICGMEVGRTIQTKVARFSPR